MPRSGKKVPKQTSPPTCLMDGRFPIVYEDDLIRAVVLVTRIESHGQSVTDPQTVKNHIIQKARELDRPELIPDNWWEEALEKQVSLKPHPECKMCRLLKSNPKNEIRPWMGTLCEVCDKPRMSHRKAHPHIIDMGNRKTARESLKIRDEDCPGFQEPDLSQYNDELTRILEFTK
jgi:hypothetical protein